MTGEIKIKKCWFCREDSAILEERVFFTKSFFVMCETCRARGPTSDNLLKAITEWNDADCEEKK